MTRLQARQGVPEITARPGPHRVRIRLVALLICLSAACSLQADRFVLRDPAETLLGKVTKDDGRQIIVRSWREGNSVVERTIPRERIVERIDSVSEKRLAELQPSHPRKYLEYAEELASRPHDLEARESAIRLYLLALSLAPRELGAAAVRGLIPLARSPREEQTFRAGLLRFDPAATVQETTINRSGESPAVQKSVQLALRAVRRIRRAQGEEARLLLADPEVLKLLREYDAIVTRTELENATRELKFSARQVQRLLTLELLLDQRLQRGSAAVATTWSAELLTGGNDPVPVADPRRWTEFNLSENRFVGEKWTTSDSGSDHRNNP